MRWKKEYNGWALYDNKYLHGVVYRQKRNAWVWSPLQQKNGHVERSARAARSALLAYAVARILEAA